MKALSVLCLLLAISCAHDRKPASLNGHPVAYNSTALGNVKAQAVKIANKQNVCFDIKLDMKGVREQEVHASNWELKWVDQNNQGHPLSLSNRTPAAVPKGGTVVAPYGAYEQWTNSFYTCADSTRASDVKRLILVPKETSYKEKEIVLNWN